MLTDRLEGKWIDLFAEVFGRCKVSAGDACAILSETQSRALNVQLAELALLRLGARPFHVVVPTPRQTAPVPIRSTGASVVLEGQGPALQALAASTFVADCTLEGLMHAPETPEILKAGARILVISNEHPEALERMMPDNALEARVNACRAAGIGIERIVVDPGLGFGKRFEDNLRLLGSLGLLHGLGCALMVGASRKRFLGQVTGVERPKQRLGASLAAALWAAEKGAHFVRAHDVAATAQALAMWRQTALEER